VVRLVEASIERVAPGRSPALLEPALAAFRRFYAAHLLDRTRLYPGIAATLDALAAGGTSLSLLTNKPRGFTSAILEGLGLARHFRQRVCGDDDLPRKPDPAGVARLLHEIGAARLEAVLVGDSPIDVATARAAGVASCAVGWGFSALDALLAAAPDHLIREPAQLLDLCDAR
jgi:phosphoglycolate phosphatase